MLTLNVRINEINVASKARRGREGARETEGARTELLATGTSIALAPSTVLQRVFCLFFFFAPQCIC
jgi:hypothetical protein